MKLKLTILTLLAFTGFLFAFVNPTKPADVIYKVDVAKSNIKWTGKKVTGQHEGNVKLSSGSLTGNGSTIKGGSVVIDMTSMACTDLTGEMNGKLMGHLKSDDFFSVEKNPTANFTITKVTPAGKEKANITGKLTIKGITNEVTFPASVKQAGGVLVAVANDVKIDRTKFNIKYGSKSFFEGIGDKAIDDEFILNINLVAKK